MKKTMLIACMAVCCGISQVAAQSIKGSDTCLLLTQAVAEHFIESNPQMQVKASGGGSDIGIAALLDGSADIAMTSRKMRFDERVRLREAGKKLHEEVIAYDALAVVVHPSNPVTRLTREQLEAIFTGKIKNWKELGGPDLRIIAYVRETSSGTYEFFKESVLKNQDYRNGILSMPATGAIIQGVSQAKGAIGYVGLAYLSKQVKPLQVSYDGGKQYVEPSIENAKQAHYPIIRPLFYYYEVGHSVEVQPFINYLLSTEGQAIVREAGYIPVH